MTDVYGRKATKPFALEVRAGNELWDRQQSAQQEVREPLQRPISRCTNLCKRQLGATSSWGQWGPGDLSRRWQRRGTGNYNVNDVKKPHLKARSMNWWWWTNLLASQDCLISVLNGVYISGATSARHEQYVGSCSSNPTSAKLQNTQPRTQRGLSTPSVHP